MISYYFKVYFNGEVNIMTPTVYGYDRLDFNNKSVLIEKSKGVGIYGTPIYGVTTLLLTPKTGEVIRIDLSNCLTSAKEVNKYIKSITSEMVEKADIYGEVKII